MIKIRKIQMIKIYLVKKKEEIFFRIENINFKLYFLKKLYLI